MKNAIAITGMGVISPLGLSVDSSWESAKNGQSGIKAIHVQDGVRSAIGGLVQDFTDNFMGPKDVKKYDKFIRFAYEATHQAIIDSQLDIENLQKDGVAILLTSGIGGLRSIEDNCIKAQISPRKISPFFIPGTIINMASGLLATELGIKGPSFSPVSACASSSHSIALAAMLIETGQADVVIAGGAEASIDSVGLSGFSQMRALSTRNDNPQAASRPWDKNRDGFVLSDGAGVVILESQAHLRQRNGRAKAYLTGYGMTSDGYHVTSPDPDGDGARRAMELALAKSAISIHDVGYINAHATSTVVGDQIELKAIRQMSQAHSLDRLCVSSTKSVHGHLLGATGALEAILTVQALIHQVAPPTINLDNPEDSMGLNLCAHVAQKQNMSHALSNSFGFGGTNISLAFSHEQA